MVEFSQGKSIPDIVLNSSDVTDTPPTCRPQHANRIRPFLDHLPLSSEILQGSGAAISLGIPGLILREALNERRGLKPAIGSLRLFLEGRDPGHGRLSASADRDQFDPVRLHNRGAELLKEKLPGSKLATPVGLSNLLVWMGTGQGNKTSSFLNYIGNFSTATLSDCMGLFNRGLKINEGILATHLDGKDVRPDIETPPPHISGLLQISNSRIYGSACNTLKLIPTIRGQRALPSLLDSNRLDLAAKFGPYWTSQVQEVWIQFLGDMVDRDPKMYSGVRKSWSSCIRMLTGLAISGFKSGLTVMQTANALAHAEIVESPTLSELADWIWQNSHLGAFAGLVALGYKLPNRKAVYVALTIVFNHLDKHLTQLDKNILGFGTIFLEHLLCKVSRWTKRIAEIVGWAKTEAARAEFVPHANEFNCKALPIPLHLDEGFVAEILRHIEARLSNFMVD
ncbi:hypothetical protein FPV67DRAFT_1428995 [Lyophyllum atratum]|nr:hypothetical protein FPV67DRAFT_1428995 [Lyophyllum atratum]